MKAKVDNIDSLINEVISKCNSDPQIYSNIMQDFFKNGIEKKNVWLDSLNILPPFNTNQLLSNFKMNIYKLTNFIKTEVRPKLDIYQVLSCIFGAFYGDAIGAFCEFLTPNLRNQRNIFNLGATVIGGVKGQITDDSEMALSLAYGLMDMPNKHELDPNYIYFYYGAWSKSHPLDMGSTTTNALKPFNFVDYHPIKQNFTVVEQEIQKKNMASLSNGFLMRKSPFIAWLYYRFYYEINNTFSMSNNTLLPLYNSIKVLSENDNKITNPNNQTNVVMGFYGLMALMAIKGFNAGVILNNIYYLCNDPYFKQNIGDDKAVAETIIYYIDLYKNPNFNLWNEFGDKKSKQSVYVHMGYYLHSIKLLLYFLFNFEKIEPNHPERKYREIMNQICNLGGDTDTNCCIVGTVIGPIIGMSNFGNDFNKMLELIPPGRGIYSAALVLLLVLYLGKSNKDQNLINNDKYFLQQLLTMLYGEIQISY